MDASGIKLRAKNSFAGSPDLPIAIGRVYIP
jgi:hypothetical protein